MDDTRDMPDMLREGYRGKRDAYFLKKLFDMGYDIAVC
jgi:hypothetical protein